MTYTNTQEDYKIRSIGPVRINPSISEGNNLYTAILGPDRSKAINRYAPFFTVSPLMVGGSPIPSTLTCSPGVVDASPMVERTYQWLADGVAIPGATETSFTTTDDLDTKVISCRVTATNYLGSASADSNAITASLVQPIYLWTADYYAFTGMGIQDSIMSDTLGLAAITGLSVDDYTAVMGYDIALVSGWGIQDSIAVLTQDIYSVIFPTFVRNLPLVNPGAEAGDTSGWTIVSGTFQSIAFASARTGTRVFKTNVTGYSVPHKVTQTVAIDPADYTLIDAGKGMISIEYFAGNNTTTSNTGFYQGVNMYLEAIDGTTSAVTRIDFHGEAEPYSQFSGFSSFYWTNHSHVPKELPPNTRSVRLVMEFELNVYNNCYIDDIAVKLWTA